MNYKIFMLYTEIKAKKNGLLVALLKRAALFAEKGYLVHICTLSYNPHIHLIYKSLFEDGFFDKKIENNIKFINLYEILQKRVFCLDSFKIFKNAIYTVKEAKVNEAGNIKFYKDKKIVKYYIRDQKGFLSYINVFNAGKLNQRIKYNEQEKLSSIQILDENKCVISEFIYDINGKIVANKIFIDKKLSHIHYFDDNGILLATFEKEVDFLFHILSDYHHEDCIFIIDRAIVFSEYLLKNKKENHRIFGIIHAAHYNDPNDKNSKLNGHYKHYVEYFNKLDQLVFLTHQQKNDFVEKYGDYQNTRVIPHFIQDKEDKKLAREAYHCVCVARFDQVKRLPLLVKMFKQIVLNVPLAKLSLYGFGADEINIKNTIQECGLEDHVFIQGFTTDVNSVFQQADLMLFAGSSEGFCMAILEALSNGCPVTSFDINYGPSDMIIHGVNGILIENNHEEAYIQQVSNLLLDREKLHQLQQNARSSVEKFNRDHIFKLWNDLLSVSIKK